MDRVRIYCRNEDAPLVTSTLADVRAIHIITHTPESVEGKTIRNGTRHGDTAIISDALVKTRNMLEKIKSTGVRTDNHDTNGAGFNRTKNKDREERTPLGARINAVLRISEEFASLEEEREAITGTIKDLTHKAILLEILAPLDAPIESIRRTRHAKTIVVRSILADATLPGRTVRPIFEQYDKQHDTTVLIVRSSDADNIDRERCIDITPILGSEGMPNNARARVLQELNEKNDRLEALRREISSFADHHAFLTHTELELVRELIEANAPERFGQTSRITIVDGYIPAKKTSAVDDVLHGRGINALLERAPAIDAPILLDNPRPIRGFESLLRLYALPRYDEIDPTTAIAITFPVLFGFIIGDIGYGVAALIIAWIIHHQYKPLRPITEMLMLSAGATIVFGLLYGEVFGTSTIGAMGHALTLTPVLHRAEEIGMVFAIAAAIGIIHLTIGTLFGIINTNDVKTAIGKASWLFIVGAAICVCVDIGLLRGMPLFGGIDTPPIIITASVLVASIAGIVYAQRWHGALELPTTISNTLSYTRLAALAIASIWLAFIINNAASDLYALGGIWIALGVVLLFAGHAMNLAIGTLGAFLHTMRLHYVEFNARFYEGGGSRFKAFGEPEGDYE